MSDALIDDLLEELVPPARQPRDWDTVVRRAGRRRRRAIALAFVAVAVLAFTGISVAEDWFTGKPAPTEIKQQFVRFDQDMQRMDAFAAQQGLAHRTPRADAAKAYGVLALETQDGTVYLWAAPELSGAPGVCYLLEIYVAPHKRAATTGGCDDGPRGAPRVEGGVLGGAAFPRGNFLFGRARVGVLVRVELSDGSHLTLPVRRTFFVAQVPKHTHAVVIDAYNAGGHVVARRKYEGPS